MVTADVPEKKRKNAAKQDSARKQSKISAHFQSKDAAAPVKNQEVDFTLDTILQVNKVHESWTAIITEEFGKVYFTNLYTFLKAEFNSHKVFPPIPRIFSWASLCPLPSLRVLILGQDPYHDDGQAMGLAFSVPPNTRIPPSLLNIYKELETDIPGFKRPSHGCLEPWAKQGVLLLNTALTVRAHQAASHSGKGWETFTDAIIAKISSEQEGIVFMLWGNHAQKKTAIIDAGKHLVLQCAHPSPLSARRGFFGSGHFSAANKFIVGNGHPAIDWKLSHNCL